MALVLFVFERLLGRIEIVGNYVRLLEEYCQGRHKERNNFRNTETIDNYKIKE